jgi:radical SAM-linked protein
MITRPTRQRDPNQVREIARRGLVVTGYEEVGFLSLSAGDYSCINGVLEDFFEEFGAENVSISLPSLRTETMTPRLAEQIGRVRKSGFTMAPEAATERMRKVINKGNSEEDLLHAVDTVFQAGWELVKFYFMIGLPTERDEDVRAIVRLCAEALRRGKKWQQRAAINVGVSTFCPKPFTPFQWDAMIPLEETQRKHALIRDEVRKLGNRFKDLNVRPHDAKSGALEGALALGDRRLATAVLHAFKAGQRLDGWTEQFKLEVWTEAFAACEREHGVGAAFFAHRVKGEDEVLPFEHIDCEVTKPYLWKERQASYQEAVLNTDDCAYGNEHCTACGACDYEVVDTMVYHPEDYTPIAPKPKVELPKERATLRVRYAKEGTGVFLSHLETMTALLRTFRRARLQIPHTQGFNPKPKVGFGPACPVGAESRAEYFDLELYGAPLPEHVAAHIERELPQGLRLLSVAPLEKGAPSLSQGIRGMTWLAELPEVASAAGAPTAPGAAAFAQSAAERVAEFQAAQEARVTRAREGKSSQAIDLKEAVQRLEAVGPRAVRFTLRAGEEKATARPGELLGWMFGPEATRPGVMRMVREEAIFGAPVVLPS